MPATQNHTLKHSIPQHRNQRGWILLESLVALSLVAGIGSHLFHQHQRINRLLQESQHQLQQMLTRETRFETAYALH